MARAAVLPPSPAKRGTRTVPRSNVTKTTASSQAKAVTDPKRRGVTKTTTARKNTLANIEIDSDDTEDELGMMMKEHDEKPARPRGRPSARSATKASTASMTTATKATSTRGRKGTPATALSELTAESDGGDIEASKTEPLKKRAGRPRKNTVPETTTATNPETVPKPRGRPKGSSTSKTTATTRKNTRTVPEPETVAENALTRHIHIATKSTTMRSNILRGPAKKKTVTFQEPSDSESDELKGPAAAEAGNVKAHATVTRKAGLGATPMRKTTGTAVRGRKPATVKKSAAKPLSPKKDKQVAKSLSAYASSDGEEDELSSAKYDIKSPVKLIIHSPVKDGTEVTGLSSPVRRINFTPKKASSIIDENGVPKPATPKNGSSTTGLSSPVRKINFTPNRSVNAVADSGHLALPPGKSVDFGDSVFMSSPARRPEASPFQFSLRDTPNRGLLFRDDTNSAAEQDLGKGPASPLKMSPKKANLGASFLKSPTKASTPFSAKTSLIQSPPKRIPSPFRGSLFSSKGSINAAPTLDDDITISLPTCVSKQHESPTAGFEDGDLAVDRDIEMVEEVARDIFGIELQCYGRSSSVSPSPQELPAAEEPLELEVAEDTFEESEVGETCAADVDIDERLQELQEEIRHEPEDFGTICFNTMEELQKPFQNLPEVQTIQHNLILDDLDEMMETDVEEEDAAEPSAVTEVYPEEAAQLDLLDAEPEQQLPSPSEPTLGLADLEEAHSPTPSPQVLEEYIDLACHAQKEIEENEADKAEIESDYPENDETAIAQDETTVQVSSPLDTPHRVHGAEAIETPPRSTQSVPPVAPTPPTGEVTTMSFYEQDSAKSKDWLFDINTHPRMPAEDSILDTTQTEISSPTGHAACDTPNFAGKRKSLVNVDIGFTPLARKFDSWETHTPSQSKPNRPRRRGVFSLVGPLEKPAEHATPVQEDVCYPDLSRTPLADTPSLSAELPLQAENDLGSTTPQSPHTPQSVVAHQEPSEVYSPIRLDIFEDPEFSDFEEMVPEKQQPDEGMQPPESTEVRGEGSLSDDDDKENRHSPVVIPGTPIRRGIDHLRTVHTISKVPLKGEGEVSPLKLPRKRGHSLESRSPTRSSPRMRKPVIFHGNETVPTFSPHKAPRASRSPSPKRRCSTPRRSIGAQPDIQVPQSPSVASSAGKTPRRKSIASQPALRGAVVYVDVHTTEGEDASGIFVELLQQMGARCFRSWSWNPRSSMSPVDGVDPKESKVGITHVVYKDGGLRTLEKVKHAGGLVKCVGVGWVLDCERENKWLDETPYTVDSSIIPRGGAKRRKSMEPRALSNVNGTLVRVAEPSTPSASGRRCGADRGAVEGFRKITPPTPLAGVPSTPVQQSDRYHVPATPGYNFENLDAIGMSPATPYFLSNRAKLVQKSCPPKQSNRGLFEGADRPIFSLEQDDEVESRRQQRARMEAARRKSHFYKPSAGSPLKE